MKQSNKGIWRLNPERKQPSIQLQMLVKEELLND
jgi:hypothetical protein